MSAFLFSQRIMMNHPDVYRTIQSPATGVFKDKGSKFLSYAFPVSEEQEIKDILMRIKKENHSARHHCFAWILGAEKDDFRMNDDGEPSGTAGRPIFNQLKSFDLTNILIIVVRYFGGILLGTNGLTTAYKKSAFDALSNADIVEKTVEDFIEVKFDYPAMNDYMHLIKDMELRQIKTDFGLSCYSIIAVRRSLSEIVVNKMNEIEHLKATIIKK